MQEFGETIPGYFEMFGLTHNGSMTQLSMAKIAGT